MTEILLVEDEESVNRGIEFTLTKEGYQMETAGTIRQAEEILKRINPKMVICDINLPDGSGLDLIREIRKSSMAHIICLTAMDTEMDQVIGYEAGADDYVTKPFSLSVLVLKFVGRISGLMNPLTYIVVNGAVIVLIYAGALRVDAGDLTQGAVVALLNYMSQILVELVKLANLIITVTKAIACGNRIGAVLNEESDMENGTLDWPEDTDVPAVEFTHVSLRYRGAAGDALSDISFRAEQGQTIGIIGGTGSGKSSLVNLIPRFYDATGGEIRICGRNICEYDVDKLRTQIGTVLQKAVLFKGTVAENLRWGKADASDAEIEEALEISQAKEFVDGKEGGTAFQIEQGGSNLSGGQKQRLTIARALVRRPRILILDDSASALDFATDARLRAAIRGMGEKPTVFIVSQRASSIQYADQIIVLEDGRAAGIGTHEELIESCPVYQEIYYSQFPKEAANG